MENGLTLYNVTANESGAPYTSLWQNLRIPPCCFIRL